MDAKISALSSAAPAAAAASTTENASRPK
ncbi:hypothetical protein MY1884_009347, partial [Beauveria asiatica]